MKQNSNTIDNLDEATQALMSCLTSHPLFGRLSPAARSKALTNTHLIKADQAPVTLEHEGNLAQNLYVLISGTVDLLEPQGIEGQEENVHSKTHLAKTSISTRFYVLNSDASLMHGRVQKTLVLSQGSQVLVIPKRFFLDLELSYPNLLKRLMHPQVIGRDDTLSEVNFSEAVEFNPLDSKVLEGDELLQDALSSERLDRMNLLGYALCFMIPAIVFWFTGSLGYEVEKQLFLVVVSAAVIMWLFSLVPNFIPAAFVLTAILSIGIVPVKVILNGFASDGFIILMSTYAIGAGILITGLGHRMMLNFFSNFGTSYYKSIGALFSAGGLLTPLMPSVVARTDVVTPIYTEAREALRLKGKSKESLHLAVTIFYSVNLFSSVFVSGSILNYLILSLFPESMADEFSWLTWFESTVVYGVVVLAGFYLLQKKTFKGLDNIKLSPERLKGQKNIMGPVTADEKIAGIAAGIFLFGVLTSAVHKIDIAWLALFSLFLLLFFRVLSQHDFRRRVDWPFLILLATTIGIASAIRHLGIDADMLNLIKGFAGEELGEVEFLLICAVIAVVFAQLLPTGLSILLGATVTVPLAHLHYIHPFVIGFLVLIINEMWVRGNRSPLMNVFCNQVKMSGDLPFVKEDFVTFQQRLNLVRVLGLGASIPYWIWLGLV